MLRPNDHHLPALPDAKGHFDRNECSDWGTVRVFGGSELPFFHCFDGALFEAVAGLSHYRNILRSAVRSHDTTVPLNLAALASCV